MKIGILVNPVAGVGAELAWKGTDDVDKAWLAIKSGENQPVINITSRALNSVNNEPMHQWFSNFTLPRFKFTKVYTLPLKSSAKDTKNTVKALLAMEVELIIFIGGDGTAIDVATQSEDTPILGIPAGVKIFSPCFLHRPEDLGKVIASWDLRIAKVELVDLDEEMYKQGVLEPRLLGTAIIPEYSLIQSGKISYDENSSQTSKLIGQRIIGEGWLHRKTVIVGPGSTMKRIFYNLKINIELLGVNVIKNGLLLIKDATTVQLANLRIDEIWLSPIGNQGHIFGRGNRQIPSECIKAVNRDSIRLFSSPTKMLHTLNLFVDTGDPVLDAKLGGFYSVVVGFYEEVLRKVIVN